LIFFMTCLLMSFIDALTTLGRMFRRTSFIEAIGVPASGQPCKWLQNGDLSAQHDRDASRRPNREGRKNYTHGSFVLVRTMCALGLMLSIASTARPQERVEALHERTHTLQAMVDALRARMGIDAPVEIALVDHDERRVSVRRSAPGAFAISAERAFIAQLPSPQVEAALAHELGHVWIYTHHPYLQTEQLANRLAMRAVTRERLVEVYRVLWGSDALHGSLETFLGIQAAATAQQ
jgi:hypothetical protein